MKETKRISKPQQKFEAFNIGYRQKDLVQSPHVVKLSGGRSSACMLLNLLARDQLSFERGDVVVFNNTSAEHPETYKFVSRLKHFVESEYGIPFFLTEFATYEDISAGNWVRFQTFRLVNDEPRSEGNPDGYHYKGEVFEELLSHTAFLPNRHRRVCTSVMKINVTEQFLSHWFACEPTLEHLGHYGNASRMTDEGICTAHEKNGGRTPCEVLLRKREFVRNRPVSRPEQNFQDFTLVNLSGRSIPLMDSATFGGVVDLRSREFPVTYVALVGLRADEPERLKKLNARICGSEGNEEGKPSSERVYTPLAENGYSKLDVNLFWSQHDWDLGLKPNTNLTNCTFCFLKGSKALTEVAEELSSISTGNEFLMTPLDIDWWIRLENDYGRDLVAEQRIKTNKDATVSFIGFFGENAKFSYEVLKKGKLLFGQGGLPFEEDVAACNCTD